MGKPRADNQIHDTWNKPHVGLGAIHAQDTQQRSTRMEGGLGKTYEGHECHSLVKIFVGSLKILEDLHEDPRANL